MNRFLKAISNLLIPTIIVVASLETGCRTSGEILQPDDPVLTDVRGEDEDYAVVKVYYGTDRDDVSSAASGVAYGRDRGDGVYYGSVDVSIPRDHRMGEIERPSVLRFQVRENPSKHVILLRLDQYGADEFLERLAAKAAVSPNSEAFVFVHGYNVSFNEAARRTAQISYDLGFAGVPVFFSWPSRSSISGYPVDETNIKWATPHIKDFLKDIASRPELERLYVVGHSMGNRGLTAAIAGLVDDGETEVLSKFREIILTAPDIDADIFRRDILPKLSRASDRITLYASARDRALQASKEFHNYPRAGDAGSDLIVVEGLDTVDATLVDTGFLGHSYFAESQSVIRDLFYLIRENKSASERSGLIPVESERGLYYRVRN